MRILITGITGFVGSHLAEYLLQKNEDNEIFGIYRWRSRTENLNQIKDKVKMVECDLLDSGSVRSMMEQVKPDRIFHLAAQSYVLSSWHAPADTISNNIIGQVNILEAMKELNLNCRVQIAGSSEEYGLVKPEETPIKETNPLRPLSPYAVSKVGQDMLAYQYYKSYGFHLIRTRAFNHSGPRRGDVFVESNFAKQIVDIEMGKAEPVVMVGNLDAQRDFTDVRDVVKAYDLAIENANPGEVYNICSNNAYSIKEILDILLSKSHVKIEIKTDPARLRPSDVQLLLGDYSKLNSLTGWKPEIPFEQTLEDLLNYWRNYPQ
ncbi:MAG: GDP-mannose 4,6-dehydratase [Firmicutes bacterium]|nr:GDP-mannose 4,6-dehydratase [Bacillota bacterium]